MYPTHVAVVPYREGLVRTEELLRVSSALQTQVIRDLAPSWGVSAVVSPFVRLDDVPAGYVPLVIVEGLPRPSHGFHITNAGGPLALVANEPDWPTLASHELLELLCDPWGNRQIPGRSLEWRQGQVEYLVEVCDPCQMDGYAINGVPLSDFVTPEYYGPADTRSGRYCLTGAMNRPLDVRAGGSLTWRTATGETWQKSGADKPRRIGGEPLSRDGVDAHRALHAAKDGQPSRKGGRRGREQAERAYGRRLKASIDRILAELGGRPHPAGTAAIKKLLEGLATKGSEIRRDYKRDPEGTLRKLGIEPPADRNLLKRPLAPAEHYHGVLAALDGGAGLGDPKLADWLSTHSAFHH